MPPTDRQQRLNAVWVRHKQGNLEHAYQAYLQFLHEFPDDPTALHYLGLLAQQTGHPDTAIDLIRRSISIQHDDPHALNHLGQIYASKKQLDEAAECFERAISIDAAFPEALNNLGNIMRKKERFGEALQLYQRAIALAPTSHQGHYNLGKLYRDTRAFEQALSQFEQAIALDPTNYRAHYELALCLEELGRFDEAIWRYRAALQKKPDHARSLANLLALTSPLPDAALVERAAQVALAPSTGDEARAKLHQSIGKYHDRRGDYTQAFSHFAASNAVQRRWSKPWVAAQADSVVGDAKARFDADYFLAVRDLGHSSTQPVFIVGLPRSGTTLVEQILASHPEVFGAGELMEMPKIAQSFVQPEPAAILAAAQRYLNHLATLAPAETIRVTDKLPINYRHLGLIATLFPRAAIVHCRRDPRDVALSCFIEMIKITDLDFTSLTGVAQAIIQEARFMEHWRSVLPMRVYEIDYARLVNDHEVEIRRLIEFCGLPWNDRCLSYFKTARHVDTPSRWQVRQPIYGSSNGRWRHYEKQLQPAIELLRTAGFIIEPA